MGNTRVVRVEQHVYRVGRPVHLPLGPAVAVPGLHGQGPKFGRFGLDKYRFRSWEMKLDVSEN